MIWNNKVIAFAITRLSLRICMKLHDQIYIALDFNSACAVLIISFSEKRASDHRARVKSNRADTDGRARSRYRCTRSRGTRSGRYSRAVGHNERAHTS